LLQAVEVSSFGMHPAPACCGSAGWINRDVLNSRFDLLASYDPFVQKIQEMQGVENDLQQIPPFVRGDKQKQIHELLKQESELRSEKVGCWKLSNRETRFLRTFFVTFRH
jgi:hypothetical protein